MHTLSAPKTITARPLETAPLLREDDALLNDVILITEAGMEALRTAPVVPDEADSKDDAEAFIPDTESKVDWVLGKIADARSRAARVRENMEAIAKGHDREAEALEWKFGAALQAFARQELAAGRTGRKSIRLSNGVLGYRTKPAGAVVTDEAAALEWARVNLPAAVTERLDKKALADVLLSTGEATAFATLIPEEEVFYLK